MKYVELHCHSNFSFLSGASHPEVLVKQAHQLGYEALALTDSNGLYGIVRFNQAAIEKGVKPIFGSEITLENGHHLLLLIKDETGYGNLCQLISDARLESKKTETKIPQTGVACFNSGLIALSGCTNGAIPSAILKGDWPQARRVAAEYRELFGRENFYLELQHHNLPIHQTLIEGFIRLGRELHLDVVATNNVHYATVEGRKLQDVLTCIGNHTTLDEAGGLLYPNAERYLKSPGEMLRRFSNSPEAIENSAVIAGRCRFSFDNLQTSLPDFPVPDGETDASYLRKLTYDGARRRYGELTEKVIRQLEHELAIIERLNLSGYFLIVWDIARFCKANGILCQGRGSAANSAVCFCLEITAVDPIKLDLLFERFMSENRREPPDIDIDIANNRREEAIQYVYNKYGRRHAAMVCEVITYRGRSAVRDVGKALGFSLEEVDKLAKHLDHFSNAEEIEERLQEINFKSGSKRVRLLVELCRQIKKFPRHLGIHVGGMIITKRPLTRVVPVENSTMPERSVIQWDKDDAADAGLVKIDLLGLGMLSLIDMAFKLVEKHRGVHIDPARLSYDDPKVYELLSTADTVGVFQVESRAQMNTLPRHRPRCFYDLVIEVALIRPGPIQGDMVHPYLRRRNGEEQVTYPHPSLEPILKKTLGVPLFQEQGMKVAVAAAGFSPSEADELRRAMGHKRSREKMAALSDKLIMGMVKNGIRFEAAERIFNQLAAFADFGFAESHAASFALLVYVSAFLKLYYPQEFYCALLNAQPMGFYTPSTILYEMQRRGVRTAHVDVCRSEWDCTVEDGFIRLGFRYIKSFGDNIKSRIEAAKKERAFVSIQDFVFRTGLNKTELTQLARADGFKCFGFTRREGLWEVLSVLSRSPDELPVSAEETGQKLLRATTLGEDLVSDFKSMGLSPGPHPMELVRERLDKEGIARCADLKLHPVTRPVKVAGVVVIRQRPMTAKGFIFLTLEDETGFSNIVIKPNLASRFRKAVSHSKALIVTGRLEKKDGVINVIGREFIPFTINNENLGPKSRDFR
ncbi:MAG: error-prone DNA polymerase [Candidatus Zixiibacteriota bacterium]|nr:MAG: error-prone DNA polymerase [candidate division Zixibacteria bacterium]